MENNLIKNNSKGIIEKIYNLNEEEIDQILKKTQKQINQKIKKIDYKILEKIEDKNIKKEIIKLIEEEQENYNIKISEYNKEMYKKGFKDGINMIIEVIK